MPSTKTFLCNSAAEEVEAALKLARASTHRTRFLATTNSYHGLSFGALSATGGARYEPALIAIFFGLLLASTGTGTRTSNTPSLRVASIFDSSTPSGILIDRSKEP